MYLQTKSSHLSNELDSTAHYYYYYYCILQYVLLLDVLIEIHYVFTLYLINLADANRRHCTCFKN